MKACIYFNDDAYNSSGEKIMGRNSAGDSFLKGYIKYSALKDISIIVEKSSDYNNFSSLLNSLGVQKEIKAISNKNVSALKEFNSVFYPDPNIGDQALVRSFYGNSSWSICGITHTLSSKSAMDALASIISKPVQPWDALICTSNGARKVVENVFEKQSAYFIERFGATKFVYPQLPVIPLGINTQDFVYSDGDKIKAREKFKIPDDAIVFLFVGRLSFHAKAHPLAMYQALEMAARKTKKNIVLLQCGWFANETIKDSFNKATELACPSVNVITICDLVGEKKSEISKVWACADVFCSLSDNIQETFGITPIEAMAAGLPVVVSDWDGYKDTVRDGIDGFRVPTVIPPPGLGADLAFRYAVNIDTYDRFCGYTCSMVSVDIGFAANKFVKLIEDPDLRKRLGNSARQRAQQVFDWKVIIPCYEDLWAQLADIRNKQGYGVGVADKIWPARMDPFYVFSHYATSTLEVESMVSLADGDLNAAIQRLNSYLGLLMVNFAKEVLPTNEEINSLLLRAHGDRSSVLDLIADVPRERREINFRCVNWLLKLGIFELA